MEIGTIIDAVAQGRVLVVGTAPPAGRDLDLLTRANDRVAIEQALRAHGYHRIGRAWARVHDGTPEVVELSTPAEWGLSGPAAEELFEHAIELEADARLYVPAPHHRLLILARKVPRTPGRLSDKHRRQVASALSDLPEAFAEARSRARDWHVSARLRKLRWRYERPAAGRLLRFVHRPRRGAVIALSGLDGAGKSTQAEALRAGLATLGYDAVTVWTPIGSNAQLRRLASAGKRMLARLPVGPYSGAGRDPDELLLSVNGIDRSPPSIRRRAVVAAWSTVGALVNAVSLRRSAQGARSRGRVVIYDRYVLDTIVDLRFSYAPRGSLPLQEKLVRMIAPVPRCAFLLDLPPEAAHARKPDWSLAQTRLRAQLYGADHSDLGLQRLDAQLPRERVSAELMISVLAALSH